MTLCCKGVGLFLKFGTELQDLGTDSFEIPTPQYYVFYNGKAEAPDKTILRLSDAFMQPVRDGEFEWTAVMLNINNGRNKELMDKCRPLAEYALFVDKVREYISNGIDFTESINAAVNWCIRNDCMVKYLRKHSLEVAEMWLTEYNEEDIIEAGRLNGLAEGRAEGLAEGRIEGDAHRLVASVDALVESMKWSVEDACKALKVSIEEYNKNKVNN